MMPQTQVQLIAAAKTPAGLTAIAAGAGSYYVQQTDNIRLIFPLNETCAKLFRALNPINSPRRPGRRCVAAAADQKDRLTCPVCVGPRQVARSPGSTVDPILYLCLAFAGLESIQLRVHALLSVLGCFCLLGGVCCRLPDCVCWPRPTSAMCVWLIRTLMMC